MPIEPEPPLRLRSPGRVAVVLLVLLAALVSGPRGVAGGFGGGTEEEEISAEYKPAPLPLTAKAARTWIALHETMVKPPADGTTFGEVIAALRAAARGKDAETPFEWYIDPIALQLCEISRSTPVPAPFVGQVEIPLETYLGFILRPLGLARRVHDGTLIIDIPCDDCPEQPDTTAAEAWTWLLLHEVVPLRYPDETPVKDVLQAIQRATVGKGKSGRGLVIHVDPIGLREVETTLDANVTIELERAPLCTALGLLLEQLELRFGVGSDGVIVVTNWEDENDDRSDLMDEPAALDDVQDQRYYLFHEKRNNLREVRRLRDLLERPAASGKADHVPNGTKSPANVND